MAVQTEQVVTGPVEMLAPEHGGDSRAQHGNPLRVLHVLAVSVPHVNGYAVRSKYLIEAQRSDGQCLPTVVTSPFYAGNPAAIDDDVIEGIRYRRVPHPLDMQSGMTFADRMCRWLYRTRMVAKRRARGVSRMVRALRRVVRRMVIEVVRLVLFTIPVQIVAIVNRERALRMHARMYEIWHMVLDAMGGKRDDAGRGPQPGPFGRFARTAIRCVSWPFVTALTLYRTISPVRSTARFISHGIEGVEEYLLLNRFKKAIVQTAGDVQADVIHAHSPYRCGLPAVAAARQLGIPCIYEVRGLWEESSVAAGRFEAHSRKYNFWRAKESQAMRSADAVIGICEQLRTEVVDRGVPRERIFLAPNAVDVTSFQPVSSEEFGQLPADSDLHLIAERLESTVTLGYVGSIRALEGVEELVRGAGEIARRGFDVSLLIVGDGPGRAELQALAEDLGLGDRAVFTGRVPHEEIRFYYHLIDLFVISRPPVRVAKIVTPLKPLEAMALGKTLVMCDLPALRELLGDDECGLLYEPNNVDDLADACIRLINDPALRACLAAQAQAFVRRTRTWSVAISELSDAYAYALQRCRQTAATRA